MALLRQYVICEKCGSLTWEQINVGNIPIIDEESLDVLEKVRTIFRCLHCGDIYDPET